MSEKTADQERIAGFDLLRGDWLADAKERALRGDECSDDVLRLVEAYKDIEALLRITLNPTGNTPAVTEAAMGFVLAVIDSGRTMKPPLRLSGREAVLQHSEHIETAARGHFGADRWDSFVRHVREVATGEVMQ